MKTSILATDTIVHHLFSMFAAGIRWVPQYLLMLPLDNEDVHLSHSSGSFFSHFLQVKTTCIHAQPLCQDFVPQDLPCIFDEERPLQWLGEVVEGPLPSDFGLY